MCIRDSSFSVHHDIANFVVAGFAGGLNREGTPLLDIGILVPRVVSGTDLDDGEEVPGVGGAGPGDRDVTSGRCGGGCVDRGRDIREGEFLSGEDLSSVSDHVADLIVAWLTGRLDGEGAALLDVGVLVPLVVGGIGLDNGCLLYTSPSPRDVEESRMPSSA